MVLDMCMNMWLVKIIKRFYGRKHRVEFLVSNTTGLQPVVSTTVMNNSYEQHA